MSKKRIAIYVIIAVIMQLLAFQLPAYAEEKAAYSITKYYSNVTLYADGSAYFDEYITYRLIEENAVAVKPLLMSGASGISDLEVFLQSINAENPEEETLIPLTRADEGQSDANNENAFIYEPIDEESAIYSISIPLSGKKQEEKTFVYRYKLKDIVFLYKDTAAFFWQFVLPDSNIRTRNIEAQIYLPTSASPEDLNGFAVGTGYAEKQFMEDGTFVITAQQIGEDDYLEASLLMPDTLFPEGRKIIDNYAKETLISEMSALESRQLTEREQNELRYYGSWTLALLSAILCIGTGLLLYLKAGCRKKPSGSAEVKGLPANYSPAELGVLLSNKKAGAKEFFATVLHLVQSKYLDIQYDEKGACGFVLRDDSVVGKLKPHEEYALNWLTKELGKGKAFTMDAFEGLLAGYPFKFKHKADTWATLVSQKAGKFKFWENVGKMKLFSLIASLVGLLAASISYFVLKNAAAGIVAAATAIGLAAYALPLKKMSQTGLTHYSQWMMFKEYLRQQLKDEHKDLPLAVWEQYLVYSIPLGIAGELVDKLPQIYNTKDFEDGNLTLMYSKNHKWLAEKLSKLK